MGSHFTTPQNSIKNQFKDVLEALSYTPNACSSKKEVYFFHCVSFHNRFRLVHTVRNAIKNMH